jgi:hypothetical protein
MGASLAASRFVNQVNMKSHQEKMDLWDLFCMTYYYRNCGGQNVKMKPPEPPPFDKQFKQIHQCVSEQVWSRGEIRTYTPRPPLFERCCAPFICQFGYSYMKLKWKLKNSQSTPAPPPLGTIHYLCRGGGGMLARFIQP